MIYSPLHDSNIYCLNYYLFEEMAQASEMSRLKFIIARIIIFSMEGLIIKKF